VETGAAERKNVRAGGVHGGGSGTQTGTGGIVRSAEEVGLIDDNLWGKPTGWWAPQAKTGKELR
jgi:hypothetical protein